MVMSINHPRCLKVVAGAVLIRGHATGNSLTRTLYRCRLRFHAVFPASLWTKGAGIFPYSWRYHLRRPVNGHRLTRSLQNMMHPPHPPPCTENYLCGRYDFTVQVVQRQPATPEQRRSQLKTAMARPMGTIPITDAGRRQPRPRWAGSVLSVASLPVTLLRLLAGRCIRFIETHGVNAEETGSKVRPREAWLTAEASYPEHTIAGRQPGVCRRKSPETPNRNSRKVLTGEKQKMNPGNACGLPLKRLGARNYDQFTRLGFYKV